MPYGKWFAVIVAVVLVLGVSASFAAIEQDVTLTVTMRSIGVSVTPAAYGFGVMNLGETKKSDTALVVKNEGNAAEDIGIRVKDEDDKDEWTLSLTAPPEPGANVYTLGAHLSAGGLDGSPLTKDVQWCDGTNFDGGGNDMAAEATVPLGFLFEAPTSVSGTHAAAQHAIIVEVSCRVAQ